MFVMKSDVKGYYVNIDHHVLYELCQQSIEDDATLRLVWGYLRRTITYGGNYWDVTRGISLGCPLSPLMGALYLLPLDTAWGSVMSASWTTGSSSRPHAGNCARLCAASIRFSRPYTWSSTPTRPSSDGSAGALIF
ncbi:MAG: hypothetical protein GY801_45825 [bacterium]|nr:hypothetical protein [bacterium]